MSSTETEKRLIGMVPFYVNGSLDDEGLREFEQALASSANLQREVAAETELQSRVTSALQNTVDSAGPAPSGKLSTFMGGAGDNSAAAPGGLAGALSFLNPRNWKPAVTFALVAAAVGQAAFIGGQSGTISQQETQIAQLEADNYRLASGAVDCDAEATLLVEVSEAAVWGEVTAFLANEQLLITRSTAQGVLMLRHAEPDTDMAPIVERLNASPLIVSASKKA